MAKHDWPTIRREYVEGIDKDGRVHRPTMRELAERHRIDESNVRRRAKDEGWTAARHEFGTKAAQAREASRVRELATEGAAFDRRMLRFAGDFMALVERARKAVVAAGKADHLELARLAQAARHAQVIAKVALGEQDAGDELPPPAPAPGVLAATVRVVYERQPLPEGTSGGG